MGFLSIKSIIPVGTVFPFAGTSAPEGWMMCDGRSLNNVDYPELFSVLGYSHGGNLTSAFNIPDYRGRFLRGSDNMGTAQGAASRDPDRSTRTAMNTNGNSGSTPNTVGSIQDHAFREHTHSFTTNQDDYAALSANQQPPGFGRDGATVTTWTTSGASIGSNANETRPINAYVNYIIKI